ncbi:MAG: T9SS type A sorting domain-containing protein [Bacteroidales bacterium]|nr:T9SS type A sorting domain-containing protein [Bacteroidales bacterium]
MRKLFLIQIFFVLFTCVSEAQIGVGEWRDHLPFTYSRHITESAAKIYVASENGIFSYSKSNQNIEKYTKVNLLSDIGISAIVYSEENKLLIAGYSNGNIDLIFDNEVYNISDIKREIISGSKSVNHILFINEYAYISCGFGIVVVNTEKREIKETYYIGDLGSQIQVNQLVLSSDFLYAATNQGVYKADLTNPNLVDYSNWQILTDIPSYTSEFNSIYVNNGDILVNQVNESSNDNIYLYKDGFWNSFDNNYTSVNNIHFANSRLHIVTDISVLVYNSDLSLINSVTNTEITNFHPFDAISDESNTFFIADNGRGLIKYQNGNEETILPNAPYLANAFSMDIKNERLLVAAGGLTPAYGNVFLNGIVFSFQNERWTSLVNYEVNDYITVEIDPFNTDHYFAGSWGKGLIEYRNNEVVETYNETDGRSTLQSMISGDDFCRISGLAYDNENNLWIANSEVADPVSVFMSTGDWHSYNYEEKISNILTGDIIITKNNQKWIILPGGNGLFVFDNQGTISDKNDDLFKKLSILDENGKIISNSVYSIAEDLNGDIWVGTDQGIVIYYQPETVFEDGFYARRIILTVGELTQYLLNTELISSIAVDGANRKWIGTHSSGVYLVSKDGTEEINHFTADNSPLLSDRINNIAINHETGEVFFATDKGLISCRGSATMGSDDFGDVYVYPNPVRENYDGDITIRGLASDVNVKITDISGNIVYETNAEGGQATWNGQNFSGSRVSTGVYLVFCTNDDGSKTYITKLLFIK